MKNLTKAWIQWKERELLDGNWTRYKVGMVTLTSYLHKAFAESEGSRIIFNQRPNHFSTKVRGEWSF